MSDLFCCRDHSYDISSEIRGIQTRQGMDRYRSYRGYSVRRMLRMVTPDVSERFFNHVRLVSSYGIDFKKSNHL